MTDEQREEKNRKWRESYQREKVCAASMTDEQREEKNRKWREAYKRKKCHAHKENMPGLHVLELFDLTVGLLVPISYCAPWCKLLFHLMPFQSA